MVLVTGVTPPQSQTTVPHKESTSDGIASNSILGDPYHIEEQTYNSMSTNPDLVQQVSPQDLFEKHIEEIDCELGKFELPIEADHEQDMPGNTSTHICSINAPISMHTNPLQIPNPTPSPPIILDENLKHHNSPEDTAPLSTWKRIPKVDKPVIRSQSVVVELKRTSTSYTSHSDLPNKNFWFLIMMQIKSRYWRRLVPSLARSNETVSMKLSRAWKPAYRRSTYRRSLFLFIA